MARPLGSISPSGGNLCHERALRASALDGAAVASRHAPRGYLHILEQRHGLRLQSADYGNRGVDYWAGIYVDNRASARRDPPGLDPGRDCVHGFWACIRGAREYWEPATFRHGHSVEHCIRRFDVMGIAPIWFIGRAGSHGSVNDKCGSADLDTVVVCGPIPDRTGDPGNPGRLGAVGDRDHPATVRY